ncbi:Melatonin-related receptor [Mactra antiquata]
MDNTTAYSLDNEITSDQLTVIRVFSTLTTILGTIGNTLTIAAIVYGRLHQQASFLFILNLSVCNLIHCVVFLPLLLVQSYHDIWTYNQAACVAYSFGFFSVLGAELWLYSCITINRYICVVHHQNYGRYYGGKIVTSVKLIFSWMFYPVTFLLPLTKFWGDFEYVPKKLVCYPFAGYNCRGFCLFIYVIAIISTVPVIIFCYLSIIHKYVKTQRKVGLSREKTVSQTGTANHVTTVKTDSDKKRAMSEVKMAFTILAVISIFGSCRLPFMILYLYDPSMSKVNPMIHTVLIYIGSCSNFINPVIYSFTNKTIFKSLKKMFATWKKTFEIQSDR